MKLRALPPMYPVNWDKDFLPISPEALTEENLDMVRSGSLGIILWNYLGVYRIVPWGVMCSMWVLCYDRKKLSELGRTEAIPNDPLGFTWDQTISLEEYLNQLGQPLDGQA